MDVNIAEYVRRYAREKKISCASIEREMGWTKDTIRKMKPTDLYKRRVRDLSIVYPDLYDVVPALRVLAGTDSRTVMRDTKMENLEKIIKAQDELIASLRKQIQLLEERGG